MRIKIFISALCLIVATSAMSQVSFGVQGGGVYSMPRVDEKNGLTGQVIKGDPKFGYQAGLIADIPFGEGGLRLMPELNYINKGHKFNTTVNIGTTVSLDYSSSINYIELPLNLAYTVPVGDNFIVLGVGPYGAYGINGKKKLTTSAAGSEQKTEEKVEFGSSEKQLDRFDYGLNFMAGYLVGNGLEVKLNYSFGLAELSNSTTGRYKNSYLGLSVGYFFKQAGK